MKITIYHNPACETSRNVVHAVEQLGFKPDIVEYLQTGWQRDQLSNLLEKANLTPKAALRISKSPAVELGLTDENITDEEIFEAMLKYPLLVNRPIVECENQARLCRPSETIFEFLGLNPETKIYKEDGSLMKVEKTQ